MLSERVYRNASRGLKAFVEATGISVFHERPEEAKSCWVDERHPLLDSARLVATISCIAHLNERNLNYQCWPLIRVESPRFFYGA